MQPVLTIAIPTYNRPQCVVERLQEIIPQCRGLEHVEVLVIDNASTDDVRCSVLEKYPGTRDWIRFHRNVGNVGLAGNICRCYEVATGSWVWTLGDDDSVEPDAVQQILNAIARQQDLLPGGFNFSTGIHTYPGEKQLLTLDDYCAVLKEPKAFSNSLFLSSCVFRRDVFLKYLRCAYLYIASAAPHIAVPVQALLDGVPFVVEPEKIVKWFPPDPSEQWNSLAVAKSLPLLGEIGDCVPVLQSFVEGYRIHLPGGLRLKVGFKRIFSIDGRSPLYWCVYYNRISPYLPWRDWIRANLCSILAGLAHRISWLRVIGTRIARRVEIKTHQAAGNMDRL
jgi:glycosyltransferase involved in cell wall biosynthesis